MSEQPKMAIIAGGWQLPAVMFTSAIFLPLLQHFTEFCFNVSTFGLEYLILMFVEEADVFIIDCLSYSRC